jgi:hypothetical protein
MLTDPKRWRKPSVAAEFLRPTNCQPQPAAMMAVNIPAAVVMRIFNDYRPHGLNSNPRAAAVPSKAQQSELG